MNDNKITDVIRNMQPKLIAESLTSVHPENAFDNITDIINGEDNPEMWVKTRYEVNLDNYYGEILGNFDEIIEKEFENSELLGKLFKGN